MTSNKIEMSDIKVIDHDRSEVGALNAQTRTRRLFSLPQIFCFAIMYLTTWQAIGGSMFYALINGGPAAYVFNTIIVLIGATAQAAVFAELASILPIAGAQYDWTHHFGPEKHRNFLTSRNTYLINNLQGWVTWLGYVVILAAVVNSIALGYEGAILVNFPEYQNGGYHTYLIVVAQLVFFTIANLWFFAAIPWLELAVGIPNICLFFLVITSLWIMSPRNSPEFAFSTVFVSGYENKFVGWNVGMLAQIWIFQGFESIVHMGEETKNAKRAAPLAMFWSLVCSGVLGLLMSITYVFCMPALEGVLTSAYPTYHIYSASLGPTLTTIIAAGLGFCATGTGMSSLSSISRITWAWARDGGLPAYFGHVDAKHRVPIRAVLLTCIIVLLLNLLTLSSGGFIALGATNSLSSISLYFSYLIVLIIALHRRLTTRLPRAQWSMGKLGLPVNVFALIYTLYTMIWLPFPISVPVDATNFNYSGPVFLTILAAVIGAWFVWAEKHWQGVNQAVVDVVLENSEK